MHRSVAPKRNNAQYQPLTTVLRNILTEYPAGGGVLRELIQNSDDAGASAVEFVLDERAHPQSPLLHAGLAEYQGPSLLAYNDSVFSEADFQSLSRIGDSMKKGDLTSTGKFGRGFNSVYNWTDGPAILSGTSLLILDPQEKWSPSVGCPGGPLYDFVEHNDDPGMQNQLAAFNSLLNTRRANPFQGTIIRIPLRSQEQARESKIVAGECRGTTKEDILEVFRTFSEQLPRYLMFLRNIREITLKVGEDVFANAVARTEWPANSVEGVNIGKKINQAYRDIYIDGRGTNFDINFIMDITYFNPGTRMKAKKVALAMSHHMRKNIDNTLLENWARKQKLLPWVIVAGELQGSLSGTQQETSREEQLGILSTTLPLSISTKHPLHINALFSITPDRRALHSATDNTLSQNSEMKMGADWNRLLFERCVVQAWANYLQFQQELKQNFPERVSNAQGGWSTWPAAQLSTDRHELWSGLLTALTMKIMNENLGLFPTVDGGVGKASEVLFCRDQGRDRQVADALGEAGIPCVFIPTPKQQVAATLAASSRAKFLSPQAVRAKMKNASSTQLVNISKGTRNLLLSYVISDSDFRDLGRCKAPLLPVADESLGDFSDTKNSQLYLRLPKDRLEFMLFSRVNEKQINIDGLQEETWATLKANLEGLRLYTKVMPWTFQDGLDYCRSKIFHDEQANKTRDIIYRGDLIAFVDNYWKWQGQPYAKDVFIGESGQRLEKDFSRNGLWLVPILCGQYLRSLSNITDLDPVLDISDRGPSVIRRILREVSDSIVAKLDGNDKLPERIPALYTGNGFSHETTNTLLQLGYIVDGDNAQNLLNWLYQNRNIWGHCSEDQRKRLLGYFMSPSNVEALVKGGAQKGEAAAVLQKLRGLEIYRRAPSFQPGTSRNSIKEYSSEWISLDDPKVNNYVGLIHTPLLKCPPGTIFVDLNDHSIQYFVRKFPLVDIPHVTSILSSYAVPTLVFLAPVKDNEISPELAANVRCLSEYILPNIYNLSPTTVEELSEVRFIPAGPLVASPSSVKDDICYITPRDLVDPHARNILPLFLPNEKRFPARGYYKYLQSLRQLGATTRLTRDLVLDRVKKYSEVVEMEPESDRRQLEEKVKQLLSLDCPTGMTFPEKYQTMKWLPAAVMNAPGSINWCSMRECRDANSSPLVGFVMPTITGSIKKVSESWRWAFGWEFTLDKQIIISQMKKIAEVYGEKEAQPSRGRNLVLYTSHMKCILDYILEHNMATNLVEELRVMEWVPIISATKGSLLVVKPEIVYMDSAEGFEPYFGEIINDLKYLGSPHVDKLRELYKTLGIREKPSYRDLAMVLEGIECQARSRSPAAILTEAELDLSIAILRAIGARFPQDALPDLKAPSEDKVLVSISSLTAGCEKEADSSSKESNSIIRLHPKVSKDIAASLRLPTVDSRNLASILIVAEEFGQNEERTHAIADILKRYAVPTTFDEYLANADDCGTATTIQWILDDRPYRGSAEELLSENLSQFHNVPSLLCYNDGLFSEKDFSSIVKIGVSFKDNDSSLIGRFGRGSLTMYHWTSLPSFISGEDFVIFDPQQIYLPLNYSTRKPYAGMRMKIRDVQSNYPGQLRPFYRFYGFQEGDTSFRGTLFRFPLRQKGKEPKPKDDPLARPEAISLKRVEEYLMTYYSQAKISLLFLDRINTISFRKTSMGNTLEWVITSGNMGPEPPSPPSKDLCMKHMRIQSHNVRLENQDTSDWCVVRNSSASTIDIPPQMKKWQQRFKVLPRYAIAVQTMTSAQGSPFNGRIFSQLPLPVPAISGLPVHICAEMIMTSDRQHIPVDKSATKQGADWNRWILETFLTPTYLVLVEQLTKHKGTEAYNLWPTHPTSEAQTSTDPVARFVATSFWKLIQETSAKLYVPLSAPGTPSAKPSDYLALSRALFDLFLLPEESKFFEHLLLGLGVQNLVSLPYRIRRGLLAMKPSLAHLCFQRLIQLFSAPPSTHRKTISDLWKEHANSMDYINRILKFVVQHARTDMKALVNCKILPLADGTLGSFYLNQSDINFLCLPRQNYNISLFESLLLVIQYSDAFFVNSKIDPTVLQILCDAKDLNVETLTSSHIPRIVRSTLCANPFPSVQDRVEWLNAVWGHMRSCMSTVQLKGCLRELSECEIYMKVGNTQSSSPAFLTPNQFHNNSPLAILQPDDEPSTVLLQKFEGLLVIDRMTFPPEDRGVEGLKSEKGLSRLCECLSKLAKKDARGISNYIHKNLAGRTEYHEQLRGIFFPETLANGDWARFAHRNPMAIVIMKEIPVWPVPVRNNLGNASVTFKAAGDVHLGPDAELCKLVVGRANRFMNPEVAQKFSSQLGALGVKKMSLGVFFQECVKPFVCTEGNGQNIPNFYVPILRRLGTLRAGSLFGTSAGPNEAEMIVGTEPLAVDCTGTFRYAKELYNHDLPCFQAAFREASENAHRFLHPQIRAVPISLWDPYLNATISQETFLVCAKAMQRRLSQSNPDVRGIIRDAELLVRVLVYELATPRGSGNQLSEGFETFCLTLGNIRFVPIMQSIPAIASPEKRLHLETQAKQILTTLSQCACPAHASICWSVKPIWSLEISAPGNVGRVFTSLANPSFETVSEHLHKLSTMRLAGTEAIRAHVKEIEETYQYLEKNLAFGRTGIFSGLGAIWFNIDMGDELCMSEETLARAWVPTQKLCLGLDFDSERLKAPRTFISRYKGLLKAAGVKAVKGPKGIKRESILPSVFSNTVHGEINLPQAEYASSVLGTFDTFRKNGTFCDTTLQVENRMFTAHRAVLASASLYWEKMFTINMRERTENVVPLKEIRPETVATLLDYIYTGAFTLPSLPDPEKDGDTLNFLLDLLEASNLWLMDKVKGELEIVLANQRWIKPDTVTEILDIAKEVRAHELERVCMDYISDNRDVVQSVQSDS